MDTVKPQNSKNLILNFLTDEEFEELSPKLERIEMTLGDTLNSPQEPIQKVYFPETSVISVVTLLENGMGVESGIIGREGISGASVILTDKEAFSEATVQLSGEGFAMDVEEFRMFFDGNEKFRRVIFKYIHAFISQISQNAACLSYHTIEKRLARWLLMFYDRSTRTKMEMTQEFISQMLGVHRPSVSKNANKLQKLGFIEYNRGVIEILDRESLEEFSCECYQTINRALSRYISF
jgi:CRP-like cAMP-binding protein